MSCKDLFALGVRLFGVWLITRGLVYLEAFIDIKLYPASDKARDGATANLIYTTLDFAPAAFFLLGTRSVVEWTYGEESKDDKDEPIPPGGSLAEPGGTSTSAASGVNSASSSEVTSPSD